jgi:hypothetical protein
MLCGEYESFAHMNLGAMLTSDASEEGFKIMIPHYKKARAIYNLVGMKDKANHLDTVISVLTAEEQGANDADALSSTEKISGIIRNLYELHLNTKGMDSEDTIRSGLSYAKQLRSDIRRIEAERLVAKLATISRRVHGPDHRMTIEAAELLELCKERYVIVLPECQMFRALRYENDGEICVVMGPITKPRMIEDERVYNVEWNLVIPNIGCPVICHGLVSASHLNGKPGEVRNLKHNEPDIRCAVYFEKKSLKSALVKPENLRVAFELPDEK